MASGWPAGPTKLDGLNPLLGIFAAAFRQNKNGTPKNGISPQEKIGLMEAMESHSLQGAYALHDEHVRGSLQEGKFADLVVLEKDPFKITAREVPAARASLVMVGGKIVYQNDAANLQTKNH
jgi:predicted amidohydrolase YtcJ